jgi:hypothetical protein
VGDLLEAYAALTLQTLTGYAFVTDQHRFCVINGKSRDHQKLLQKAADGLDPTRRAPAAAAPRAGVKWGLGGDILGVVSKISRFSPAGGSVTP